MSKEDLITQYNLQVHPEGGYYKETYRSPDTITLENGKLRNTSTAIFYMLSDNDRSHFHKIGSDEIWFYHEGKTLNIFIIHKDSSLVVEKLGNNVSAGEKLQVVVPANTWFAASVDEFNGYCLVSCVVAPGFDFEDFILADKADLLKSYPEHKSFIELYS